MGKMEMSSIVWRQIFRPKGVGGGVQGQILDFLSLSICLSSFQNGLTFISIRDGCRDMTQRSFQSEKYKNFTLKIYLLFTKWS